MLIEIMLLSLDLGSSYTGTYFCKNSPHCTVKVCVLCCVYAIRQKVFLRKSTYLD